MLAALCVLPFWSAWRRSSVTIVQAGVQSEDTIRYAADGSYLLPQDYREWVFLSAGMDMSYNPQSSATEHHMFNNVFASPSAYRSFQTTGTWPDKTALVLEVRGAEKQPSLNKHGQTQGREVMGLEVHLKDTARFPGGWAFFDVGSDGRGRYFKPSENCYSCHRDHAAVDTTFAQFYPTLLPAAEAHRTMSAAYLAEHAMAQQLPSASK